MSRSPALRALALAALLLCAALAQGCGNACLTLASQICQCLPDDGTRAYCNQRAKTDQDNFPVRAVDETFCQQKLDSNACDCTKLSTPEGKLGCGLAYPTN